MKKLLPCILLLCVVLAWGAIFVRGQGTPKEYTEYIHNAEVAYEQGYYVETLNWIQKAEAFPEEVLSYGIEQKKREAYRKTGDMDSYVAQCKYMISSFPEKEESYVMLMEYYDQIGNYGGMYQCIDEYVALWPENTRLQEIQAEYNRKCDYFNMGYYDIRYATDSLIDVQRENGQSAGRELCRSRGDAVFDHGYKQMVVSSDSTSCFVQTQDNKWLCVNIANNLLAINENVSFEKISKLSTAGLATAVIDGKYYFINEKMRVSDIEWEAAGTFSEGINAVKQNGKWALVTAENWGDTAIFPYTAVPLNSMGYCVVEGRSVVADETGYYIVDTANKYQSVTEHRYEEMKAFESNQPTAYRKGSKWGFVNKYGEVYHEAEYEDALPYKNGYAAVKQNGLWGYIDWNGKMIIEPQYQEALNVMPDGVAYVKNDLGYWDYLIIYKLYYESAVFGNGG